MYGEVFMFNCIMGFQLGQTFSILPDTAVIIAVNFPKQNPTIHRQFYFKIWNEAWL